MLKTIEEKLKEFILSQYKSIREFSMNIVMPYSTVDSIFKRGIANASVTNVNKICKSLNISADMLADGKIVYIDNKNRELTQEEKEIIEAYRRQPHLHEAVQKVLGIYNNDTPSEKSKKTLISHHDVEVSAEVGDLAELDADEVLKNNRKTSSVD